MRVILSNEAKQDLDGIFEYIANDSEKYAIQTHKNIRLYIHSLRISPYIGRYVPELVDKNFREIIYKSYRIVYEVSEDINIVYIHFIIHRKTNFKSFYKSYIKNNF